MATFGQIPSNVPFNNFRVVTSSTRPSSPAEGDHIYETDTKLVYFWDGSAWLPLSGQVIASNTLSSTASSISLPATGSLPTGFNAYRLVLTGRSDAGTSTAGVNLRFNSDTGNNYRHQINDFNGSTFTGSNSTSTNAGRIGQIAAANSLTNAPGIVRAVILFPESTTFFKGVEGTGFDVGATALRSIYDTFMWESTAAITSITVSSASGSFIAGTQVVLTGDR